jgi:hypothetical protein
LDSWWWWKVLVVLVILLVFKLIENIISYLGMSVISCSELPTSWTIC